MTSAWIMHIKKVQKEKGITFKEAMGIAAESYKPSPDTASKKGKKVRHSRKKARHSRKRGKRKGGGAADSDSNTLEGETVTTETTAKGSAGTMNEGAPCTLPARDGSGSITIADLNTCRGGGRKSRRKMKKRRKTRRKTRRKMRGRTRKRKSRRRRRRKR